MDLDALREMLGPDTRLICVMQVCNETGVIMPLEAVCRLRDELAPKAAIHVDGVQGYLRVPFSFKEYHVQSYALSAHKIHGPKGVGALVLREGYRIKPQAAGGRAAKRPAQRHGKYLRHCGPARGSGKLPADGMARMAT